MRLAMLAASVAVLAWGWGAFPANVQASEWGFEVLLCAASSNSSWRSVSACHAPMSRLISAMNDWGFKWPTCPEAGTGRPGYERFAACPAGLPRDKQGEIPRQSG
jgi:hypothetical protein